MIKRAFSSSSIDPDFGGMNLREYYAGQALPAVIQGLGQGTLEPREMAIGLTGEVVIAKTCVEIADALLAELGYDVSAAPEG